MSAADTNCYDIKVKYNDEELLLNVGVVNFVEDGPFYYVTLPDKNPLAQLHFTDGQWFNGILPIAANKEGYFKLYQVVTKAIEEQIINKQKK